MASTPPLRILLIDSNKEDRQYWADRLTISSPAFTILEADNAEVGLTMCQSQGIDCVLLELMLPDMSGLQVLTRLIPRAYHPKIPVILFSRLNLPALKRVAINNGAQTYLVKSVVTVHELSQVIHKAIAAVAFKANVPHRDRSKSQSEPPSAHVLKH